MNKAFKAIEVANKIALNNYPAIGAIIKQHTKWQESLLGQAYKTIKWQNFAVGKVNNMIKWNEPSWGYLTTQFSQPKLTTIGSQLAWGLIDKIKINEPTFSPHLFIENFLKNQQTLTSSFLSSYQKNLNLKIETGLPDIYQKLSYNFRSLVGENRKTLLQAIDIVHTNYELVIGKLSLDDSKQVSKSAEIKSFVEEVGSTDNLENICDKLDKLIEGDSVLQFFVKALVNSIISAIVSYFVAMAFRGDAGDSSTNVVPHIAERISSNNCRKRTLCLRKDLTLRSRPILRGSFKCTTVKKGEKVKLLDQNKEWNKVLYINPETTECFVGWFQKKYMKEVKAQF